jgi:hypothetical protein
MLKDFKLIVTLRGTKGIVNLPNGHIEFHPELIVPFKILSFQIPSGSDQDQDKAVAEILAQPEIANHEQGYSIGYSRL